MMILNRPLPTLLILACLLSAVPANGMTSHSASASFSNAAAASTTSASSSSSTQTSAAISTDRVTALSSQADNSATTMSVQTAENAAASDRKESQETKDCVKVEKKADGSIVIVMPNEKILAKIFSKKGFGYLVDETKICQMLAGRKDAASIELAIGLSLDDYAKHLYMPDGVKLIVLWMQYENINTVVDEILGNNSEAKAALQEFRDKVRQQERDDQ